jgi:DNA-binding response OmpR family regulator
MIAGVETARGDEAFRWYDSEPDVIVLDATPSVLDALAVKVHAQRRHGLVLLVVSGDEGEDVHARGREVGAVGYLKRDDDLPGLATAILGLAAVSGAHGRGHIRSLPIKPND